MSKKDTVTNFIMENITKGKYKEGSKIMSEPLLAKYLHVSRFTVREALIDLTEKKIIYKVRGSGNFIHDISSALKYIVITINEDFFMNQNTKFYINLIDNLKETIKEKGYIPYTHIEKTHFYSIKDNPCKNLEDYLSVDISEIAGLITISGDKRFYKTFENNNIPIMSIINNWSSYPYVTLNFKGMLTRMFRLAKKYKFKNIYIFTLKSHEYVVKDHFHKIPNKQITIAVNKSGEENYRIMKNEIKKIKDNPDLLIFTDDTLYSTCIPLFSETDIFKNAKIITHSNNTEIYPESYNICRLTYYTEDFAQRAVDTIISFINKEIPKTINNIIDYKIINEETLKNN